MRAYYEANPSEFSHPEHMLKAIRKALKPDGVTVTQFNGEDAGRDRADDRRGPELDVAGRSGDRYQTCDRAVARQREHRAEDGEAVARVAAGGTLAGRTLEVDHPEAASLIPLPPFRSRAAARRLMARIEEIVAQQPDNGQALGWGVGALAALGESERASEWAERAPYFDRAMPGVLRRLADHVAETGR